MSTGHHADTLDAARGLAAAARSRWPSSSPPSPRRSPARGSCTTTAPAGCWRWPCSGAPASGWSTTSARACSTRWASSEAVWIRWAGADLGYSGLHISTDTVARLGQLLLARRRVAGPPAAAGRLGRDGVEPLADTTHHPDPADWKAGYGYQMWRSRARRLPGRRRVRPVRPGAARARPRRRRDVVHRDHLRGARRRLGGAAPAPRRRAAAGRPRRPRAARGGPRRRRRAGRRRPPPPHRPHPRPWAFTHAPTPEHPRLRSVGGAPRATHGWLLEVDDGERAEVPCGDGRWPDAGGSPWVASGGWVGPGVFEATVVAVETPHSLLLRCADGDGDRALARRPAARPCPGPAARARATEPPRSHGVAGWCTCSR